MVSLYHIMRALSLTANSDLWDTKGGRMIGKSMQALEVNRKLATRHTFAVKHEEE